MLNMGIAETKACCYLAYDAQKGESYRFPDGSMWDVVDAWKTSLTGFKAILLCKKASKRAVLAFAGTDSIRDIIADGSQVLGILPMQYPQALSLGIQCQRKYNGLHLCGHSLGGGLAAYVSVQTKLLTSTINPAPLVAGAGLSAYFGDHSQIVNYIAGGNEFVSSSPGRNPGKDVAVSAVGNFFTRHMLGNVETKVTFPTKITRK